jgi:hypothetical protein
VLKPYGIVQIHRSGSRRSIYYGYTGSGYTTLVERVLKPCGIVQIPLRWNSLPFDYIGKECQKEKEKLTKTKGEYCGHSGCAQHVLADGRGGWGRGGRDLIPTSGFKKFF